MLDHVPTVRARQLGRELTRAMEKTGRTRTEMAGLLAWSPSKLSRLLNGRSIPSQVDIAALLAMCAVTGPQRDEVLQMAEDARASTWWQDYGTHLPIYLPTLTDNEAIATRLTTFHNTRVPDLLQTPAYTRALLQVLPNVPDDEIDERVAETMRRQQILEGERPPTLRVFLDEYVLTRSTGGDEMMSGQAHHLLRMSVRPEIKLRVVPERAGVDDAKPFTLLEFDDLRTVAYLEHTTFAAFFEGEKTIAAYQRLAVELAQRALSEPDSRERLAAIGKDRRVGHPMAYPRDVPTGGR